MTLVIALMDTTIYTYVPNEWLWAREGHDNEDSKNENHLVMKGKEKKKYYNMNDCDDHS